MFYAIKEHIKLLIIDIEVVLKNLYKKFFKKKFKKRYEGNEGNFIIEGSKENFIIKKNNRFEFLVKNGQIVAFKDLNRNREYVYNHKGENDGIF